MYQNVNTATNFTNEDEKKFDFIREIRGYILST